MNWSVFPVFAQSTGLGYSSWVFPCFWRIGMGVKRLLYVFKKLYRLWPLVSFLHLVQITTVSSSWKTLYVIVCVVVLAPAVIGFLRAEKKTVILVHQFLFLLFLYEIFNFGLVILQTRELESNIESRP